MRQALDAVRQVTEDDKIIESVLRSALKTAVEIDYNQTPVEIGRLIHRKIREETGNPDPYLEIKNKANQAAKGVMPLIKKKVESSPNPFEIAVKYAIAGNILDFALFTGWDNTRFQKSMEAAGTKEIDTFKLQELENKVKKAKSILLLGDNAGEVVFDRILLEQMPAEKLYYAVKGEPVINDVLLADALFAGIDEVAEIISNGTDSAGTLLSACSQEFLDVFNSVELVIAKGQGNFESLNECGREVYFLTQIKCKIIARDLNGAVGDWVVASNMK
jgi:uncharacterized protein with ATP-grasp and redox domains